MYRFALSPRWLLGHVVVVALVVLMVNLGMWQLRRLEERRAFNDRVATRQAEAPAPLEGLTGADVDPTAAADLEWRPVMVEGRYDPQGQVMLRAQARHGVPGEHVLTPLVQRDGSAVVVNRGWVPVDQPPPPPPAGAVRVTGLVRATQERRGLGPRDPVDGVLDSVARVDLDRLQRQSAADLWPVWVQLQQPAPPDGGLPLPVPPPELGEGSHLSYAVQWFIFSAIAAGGWVVLVRTSAHRRRMTPAEAHEGARSPAAAATIAAGREPYVPPARSTSPPAGVPDP